jgi:hypothetical protein
MEYGNIYSAGEWDLDAAKKAGVKIRQVTEEELAAPMTLLVTLRPGGAVYHIADDAEYCQALRAAQAARVRLIAQSPTQPGWKGDPATFHRGEVDDHPPARAEAVDEAPAAHPSTHPRLLCGARMSIP